MGRPVSRGLGLLGLGLGLGSHSELVGAVSFLRPHWKLGVAAFAGNLTGALLEGAALTLFAASIQSLIGDTDASLAQSLGAIGRLLDGLFGALEGRARFFALILSAVGLVATRGALVLGAQVAWSVIYVRVFRTVWRRLFAQFMTMSYASVSRYKIGDLSQYVWDTKSINDLLHQFNLLIGVVLLAGVYLAVMLWLSWQMTLFALLGMAVLAFGINGLLRRVQDAAERFVPARVEMGSQATEMLMAQREVRLFSREDEALARVDVSLGEAMLQTRRRMVLMAAVRPIMETMAVASVAAFLIIGSYLMGGLDRNSSLPALITFVAVIYRLLPQIGGVNQHRASILNLRPVVGRVLGMLRTDDKEYLTDGDRAFAGVRDAIRFEDVCLRYTDGERPALDDLDLVIPARSMTALVGVSGAGKSSIADLLVRLYDPTAGRITVDGVDIREFKVAEWRGSIGVVSQDAVILNDTVANNIGFGKVDASREDVERAARLAMAHEFIQSLEKGYETILGERGYRLSGGQRQRIAIARALVRDPGTLILDEATSSLDSESERSIGRAMEGIRRERTLLVIAHRLSTVRNADQIIVVEEGSVVQRGTHEELLKAGGRYADLWAIQTSSNDLPGRSGS